MTPRRLKLLAIVAAYDLAIVMLMALMLTAALLFVAVGVVLCVFTLPMRAWKFVAAKDGHAKT